MLIHVDPNSGVPAYRQIVDQVRFLVATGRLAAGSELPSTRALSEELRLNPMTVSKAYGLLESEGLLQRRPGLPLVVRPIGYGASEAARTSALRTILEPAAVATRQLGITQPHALAVFRELLTTHEVAEEHDR